MPERHIDLETIYEAETGPAFMTGIQALVRLPMMQSRLDRANGRRTAGLVTGYRGSPLGGYDQQLWKAEKRLAAHDVKFQPGLNEDLAATALWGTQMHKAYGAAKFEGVFGIWYGKGNGVDRTGDVFRNANALGTSPLGGVLAIGGDDHAAQSSMFPHQTDGIFEAVQMPILQPASVSEILSLGLAGIALSRFSGLWVAMKTIAEVVESAASFDLPDPRPSFDRPEEFVPKHGLNWDPRIAWPEERAEFERRIVRERLPAAMAWARMNRLDRPVITSPSPRICIVTVGKAHQDVMEALDILGINETDAKAIGVSVYKVAMSWPLDTQSLFEFAHGHEEIFIVEEKRPVVEHQLKAALYNVTGSRPRIVGKNDECGSEVLPQILEFSPFQIARALVQRFVGSDVYQRLSDRLLVIETERCGNVLVPFPARKPFFCSGCPHNSSTVTPDGSIAGGGIGCHVMALSLPKLKTTTFSQMGGEGMQWVGAAPFSETKHIFQNLGDGTYQHSGVLAIRAAVAANANITFKILYNDAVAMTGGQPAEGVIDPERITRQLAAEGVREIRLVSDQPDRWREARTLAAEVRVHHRDELDEVQRELRDVLGVTAIVYEQTCAAEKRRRRKRGVLADPERRLFINARVCEGCGDCSVQSNCISIEPRATAFGTKRQINQSACNKDFSCVQGFCPSFVEVSGAKLQVPNHDRLTRVEELWFPTLSAPTLRQIEGSYNIYVAGIGGLGVLTVGAMLGAAAHLDGLASTVIDFTGLAQKNGAVVSQVRIAPASHVIHSARIGPGEIDLLLGTDTVVAAGRDAQAKLHPERSAMVLNIDDSPTADIVTDRDAVVPGRQMRDMLFKITGDRGFGLGASAVAQGLFGNTVAANTLLLGNAWQRGLVPISGDSIRAAIRSNGAAVELNLRAFEWGRLSAIALEEVERTAGVVDDIEPEEGIDAMIDGRSADLTAYQDEAYSDRYRETLARLRHAAGRYGVKGEALIKVAARNAYKVMAYKDEYEVARLYSDQAFRADLKSQFAETGRLSIYLAPPLLSRIDPATGRARKRRFGPWVFPVLRLLARAKRVRGSWADPFARTVERRAERELVETYLGDLETVCRVLNGGNISAAIDLASYPDEIRGYGPVKEAAMATAVTRRTMLLARMEPDRRRVAEAA